jgi:hypothetical protein
VSGGALFIIVYFYMVKKLSSHFIIIGIGHCYGSFTGEGAVDYFKRDAISFFINKVAGTTFRKRFGVGFDGFKKVG